MTGRHLTFAPSSRDLAVAKASARRAYDRARKAEELSSSMVDRLWCGTLQAAVTAAEMMRRTEHLFVQLRDRAHWAR